MRRILVALLGLTLLAGCSAGPSKQEIKGQAPAFTNAVFVGGEYGLKEAADPAPLKFNGEYYVYVTGSPCRVLKSTDLVNWQYLGNMIEEPGSCWAPDVTYKNGIFYAYMATRNEPEVEGSRRVKLYTSDRPEGPFTFKAQITDAYSYDPDYFMDEDGMEYIYWTQECATMPDVAPCSGNGNVGDQLLDMTKLAGNLTRVAGPEGWECAGRCILEAPATLKRDGQYFMQYSAGAYENYTYGSGYLRSPYPLGPGGPVNDSWVKQNQVLKTVELKVDGPGGSAWVKAPNNLDDWTIYHGRGITRQDWDRWLRIDPVMWGRERFWLPGAPTYTPQPGPGMPIFRDLFDREDGKGLGKEWQTTGGTWSVTGGAARQGDGSGEARALAGEPAQQYLFETNLRFLPGQQGGAAGIVAYWADAKNYVTALVDPAGRSLTVAAQVGGTPSRESFPLPEWIDWQSWQQVMVRKNGDQFHFMVNGLPVGTSKLGFAGPGKTGLATAGAGAEFDGIAFAHGWEDFFDAPADWGGAEAKSPVTGDWQVKESELVQSAAQGRAESFKGSRQWGSYEFTASLRNQGSGAAGLYAAYFDSKNYVEVLLDPKTGSLQSRAVVRGKEETVSTPLSEHFKEGLDLKEYHALRVVKDGFGFRFYLDGLLVQERQVQLSQGQPGMLTVDTSAAYDSVRAVRWD